MNQKYKSSIWIFKSVIWKTASELNATHEAILQDWRLAFMSLTHLIWFSAFRKMPESIKKLDLKLKHLYMQGSRTSTWKVRIAHVHRNAVEQKKTLHQ